NADRQDMTAGVAAAPAAENQVSEQAPVVPEEAPPAQVTPPLTPPAPEPGRRRQPQEKGEKAKEQKEQAAQAPASTPPGEAAPAAQQPSGQPVAPEDLPPLEYAELQKASSRRRRRHRSGSSNAAAQVQQPQPAQPVQPVSPPPPAPGNTTATPQSAQYSIVSGYTVNQMNQGNETNGPFMAPEPSPARGSLFIRDGRSSRTESLRTSTPAFPATRTTHEGGLSAAAVNQLTSAITQAFQVQTDRMVAELRRSTQAPTNISVSLPPFPSNERVGVFVDVANLLYSARTLRIAVDFGKLLDFLRGNRRLVRAHAYCPTSPQPGDEQMFLQAVKGLGYRITTKNYKTFSSGAKKADLDLDLCMDVVRLVDGRAVDCIVLVSGDSDFMPMLDYCSDHGVRVEVAAFDEAMSATLRQSCDLFINLSMLEEIRA
ncbi:MAG: NYN domain-containing protein, partial [Ktedonobacteraceae bacterium]|nr:NYN domain-containing protein [Ktedonobacteraceae bacterium]